MELNAVQLGIRANWGGDNKEIPGMTTSCFDDECVSMTVTPEPVTMVLVGTGLAGMGLLRRRRRNGHIAEG